MITTGSTPVNITPADKVFTPYKPFLVDFIRYRLKIYTTICEVRAKNNERREYKHHILSVHHHLGLMI